MGDINKKLSPQGRFIESQLMCANYISKLDKDDGSLTTLAAKQGKKIAEFADIQVTEESLAVYCTQLKDYSGNNSRF